MPYRWIGTALALGTAIYACSPAVAMPFLPYQAVYDLSLRKARGFATLENARSRILNIFSGSVCEGYTSNFRQVSELDGGDGKITRSDLRLTSWEDGKGDSYRFKIDTRTNKIAGKPIEGSAERSAGKITVRLKQPVTKTFAIDGSVLFPTEHVRRIIAAAQAGRSVLEALVYDGSETGEKVYSTLSVIGRPVPGDGVVAVPDSATVNASMKGLTRWPVTVSYFDSNERATDGEQTPIYTMSFELYENGVARALALDYNNFVIAGAVTRFDVKDAKPCK